MPKKPKLIVIGFMGQSPFAGVAWQALHYIEGFRRLGYDVYYIEDTGSWPFDPEQNAISSSCAYTTRYLDGLLSWCGLKGRWSYRSAADGSLHGLSPAALDRLLGEAEMLVNVTGTTILREEHMRVPMRIYAESDPFLAQVEVASGSESMAGMLDAHTHLFTFGENIGKPGCRIPATRHDFLPTRQPVVLDWWRGPEAPAPGAPFTTITSWQQTGKDAVWEGETYLWSKHLELLKFVELPGRTREPLEMALATNKEDVLRMLRSHGWRVVDAISLTTSIHSYRDYIFAARGEFTVAKDQYVRPWTGWFSDRTACFLAAGRPAVTQDTGFGAVLPAGRGLFPFRTMEDILEAFEKIRADYPAHCRAAREIAEEFFSAERVLTRMLELAGAPVPAA
ncbi:MAG: hypothetical protein HYZ11_01470 [Candidatus Tectomicrobia bacterium]|uniref:Glycosyltransferase family 1 protein n=1 Tax=Tectimicrobiota bacterium TaxID=2528274 RepID=A0A932HYX2_UNCTE|nr:hypothetical protein [Candidatus Tectomicrobia bacterium]